MSELKARHIVDVYDSYYAENPFGERSQVYLKSEADKVIAEKDSEIRRLENLCESYRIDCDNLAIREANAYKEIERYNKQLRHAEYKLCLAMADACRGNFLVAEHMIEKEPKNLMWHKRHKHYGRWMMLWRCFAEEFKETK